MAGFHSHFPPIRTPGGAVDGTEAAIRRGVGGTGGGYVSFARGTTFKSYS